MSSTIDRLRAREGLIAVSLGAVLWGTNGFLVRKVADHSHLSAISIGWYRLVFSSAVLLLVAGRPSLRAWRRASAGQRLALLVSGALLGLYQALYFAAIGNVGVSVSTLVSLGVAPVSITAWQSLRRRHSPGARSLVVLALALLGLALISLTSSGHGPAHATPWLGIVESVGSGLGYAGSTLVSQRLHSVAGPLALTTVASVVGALVLTPFAVLTGLAFTADAGTVASLAYMGVVATALAYGLFFHGLRTTPSEVASVLTLLEPLAATVLAVALIGERLVWTGWLGGALMMVAIAVLYLAPTGRAGDSTQGSGEKGLRPEAPATAIAE
ncbi:EamA family transporter [Jatrophihabitans telluris]|uniref:EamA family transporter n=1 Tax=Jatrophihabitans telluris TaxID=2038343 RepID=A0ABY4QW78_9ACTN|nr:EamA family transporter [Jatrophihabitans telluris]UQX87760.1 EamA family transporter [Jatrophihabitans telluris]